MPNGTCGFRLAQDKNESMFYCDKGIYISRVDGPRNDEIAWKYAKNGLRMSTHQESAIPAFSIPIPILRLVLHLVDSDTDTRKSENFDSDSDTDTKVKQVLLQRF